jgi:CubicO group peptidase (beta-lactamase class C family)
VWHFLRAFTGNGKETVTVRDLLEHQAGLWEWWPTYVAGARTAEDALALVQSLPLRRPPRTGRHYSDLGFMLLGEIVARVHDEPLDHLARRKVFEPLQMARTGYRPRGRAAPTEGAVATSLGDWYERRMVDTGSPYPVGLDGAAFAGWRTHTLVSEANDGNCWHAFHGVAGHAGLFTSASDLLRLGRALLESLGGCGPWSAELVREFCRPGRDARQGLGFWLREGGAVVEHPGFPGARFAGLPDRQRLLVLLTNRLHTTGEPPSVDAAWDELVEKAEAA